MKELILQSVFIAFGSIFVVDVLAFFIAKIQERKGVFIAVSAGISVVYAAVVFFTRWQKSPPQYDGVQVALLIIIGMMIAMMVPLVVYEPLTGEIRKPFLRIGSAILIFIIAVLFILAFLVPMM